MLLKALIYWPLLAIAIVAILARLIHKAKVADRALNIEQPQPKIARVKGKRGDDDSDRRAA